jgi:TadE-like protein
MSWKRFVAGMGLRRSTRGQSLVEFALVSVVLFFLILGIIDVARLLFTYSVITNAAQEGSRYGIVRPREVVPNAMVTYVPGNIPTYLGTVIPTQIVVANSPCDIIDKTADKIYGVPRSDVQVSVWYDNGDATPLPLTTLDDLDAAAVFGNRIDVQTSYRFNFMVPFISVFVPNGINIRMLSARTLRTTGAGDAPPCDFAGNIAPTP